MNNRMSRWLPWLIALLVISAAANIYYFTRSASHAHAKGGEVAAAELYVCPMHPQVRQDHPGDCPICGMKLVKQAAGSEMDPQLDSLASSVHLSPAQEVLANVRTELPQRAEFVAARSIPGRIVAKEEAQWKSSARVMGRIDRLYIATPGQAIRKGQPLYDLFSPDLASAQREYMLAQQSADPQTRALLLTASRNKLQSLGMEPAQIAALEERGEVREVLTFRAPASGVLMEKMISEGDWIMPGMAMLDFVDLAEVWAEGTIYEQDIASIHLGDPVEVHGPGSAFRATGKISYIAPMVDMMTRTLVFRATLPNPSLLWKPEMFVQMQWSGQTAEQALSVPEDAILATGRSTRLWVKVDEGRYRPREVVVGPRQDGRIAVLAGLSPLEEVVVSGGYLIDSDAQLKDLDIAGMLHAGHEAEAGTERHEPAAGHGEATTPARPSAPAPGEQLYVCPMHPEVTSSNPEDRCPKCGMFLEPAAGKAPAKQPAGKPVSGKAAVATEAPASAAGEVWVCTMCPEVKSDKPGRCPECGMFLTKKEG